MAKNEFLPFAYAANADVLSYDDYQTLIARKVGFTTGVAKSKELNTAWRQSSVIASTVAQFIADHSGNDVLDNGDADSVSVNLQIALKKYITENSINLNTIYPIGIVTWFAKNKDPNKLFPGTTWNYIGEERTIRLGKVDGSDVMTTGGADSVTLATANLPAHSHTFSANTSSFDYGNKATTDFDYGWKQTDAQGNHAHTLGVYDRDSWGNSAADGTGNRSGAATTDAAGNHVHNLYVGAHSHIVGIGAHSHSVSGTTANAGSGTAVSVTNSFVKLMGWYRSA
ncbi:hypothetical protein C9426_33895 [Serratia sp. S1B]|nr:hypothetical protein C9426_33895 [Serratia sp. S1B]